jgi:hypothetical protein
MLQLFTTHFAIPQASAFLLSSESKGFLTPHRTPHRQPVPPVGLTWPYLGRWQDIRKGEVMLKLPGWSISQINPTTIIKCLRETFPFERQATQLSRDEIFVPAPVAFSPPSTPTKPRSECSPDLSAQLRALQLEEDDAAEPSQDNHDYYLRMQAFGNEKLERLTRQIVGMMKQRDILENRMMRWRRLAERIESEPQPNSAPPSGSSHSVDSITETLSSSVSRTCDDESLSTRAFGPRTTAFIIERSLDALSVNEVLFMLADMAPDDWDLALEVFQWSGDERQILKKAMEADIKIRQVQRFALHSKVGAGLFLTPKKRK